VVARWLLVWFVLSAWLALRWTALAPGDWFDPFLALLPAQLSYLIFVAMFFIGAMLPGDEVRRVARQWWQVLGGTTVQFVSMPLLALAFGSLLRLSGDDFVGIMMVGCVPGAMASNVLTLNARGNASYSVALTTMATLLSPLTVPVALGLTLQRWDAEQGQLLLNSALTLAWSVVLPVVLGFALSRTWAQAGKWLRRGGPTVANLAILWVIAAVIAMNRERLYGFDVWLLLALAGVNLCGFCAGYAGGWSLRLDEPQRRALTIEVGMQNAGLGATLALRLFPDRPGVAIAPAMFMFGCMLTGTILAQTWAWWDDRRASAVVKPDEAT
jgi:bile acid:Na+ symporter, BASS family